MHFKVSEKGAGYKNLDAAVKENILDFKRITGLNVGSPPKRWFNTDSSGTRIKTKGATK